MNNQYFAALNSRRRAELEAELKRLQQHSEASPINLERLDGFYTALHCGPFELNPHQDRPLPLQCLQPKTPLLLQHWHNVGQRLNHDEVFLPLALEQGSNGRDWAQGFIDGAELYPLQWCRLLNDPDHGGAALGLVALAHIDHPDPQLRTYQQAPSPKQLAALTENLVVAGGYIYRYYAPERASHGQPRGQVLMPEVKQWQH
ncbi:MAG: UPF0149 family protein [Cellvibrionaceae bacterium]|nr:UPF0149 family protein [Cellvibrionaceae bacterium]MCV6627134.1 UPF0149 family protein [Cellvibrionaceae bacterium]